MGGLSKEREISLRSGRAVASALKRVGYAVIEIDAGRDLPQKLAESKVDGVVIMLHGRWGEDGTVQGLLEVMGIPYSGSGPLASAISLDKNMTQTLLSAKGIRVPPWRAVASRSIRSVQSPLALREAEGLPFPVVIKPNREGSTIGISIVRDPGEFQKGLEMAAQHDDLVLIEEFIEGTEVTVGLVDGQSLPPLEIVPKSGFYDYQSKYTKGMTEYIVPARIPEDLRRQVSTIAVDAFQILGMAGIARADFMLRGEPWFLEINSIPGMTETSLVPKAAEAAGISFEELCERLVRGISLKV
jgi:D-alanine-D-alanine ligase